MTNILATIAVMIMTNVVVTDNAHDESNWDSSLYPQVDAEENRGMGGGSYLNDLDHGKAQSIRIRQINASS